MTDTQRRKRSIRQFLRTEVWSDEKLCQLLAHAESKLAYKSCCCLIGSATADHALRGRNYDYNCSNSHFRRAQDLPKALEAESAYYYLPYNRLRRDDDDARRRILRPIIRAEIRRRDRLKLATTIKENEYATV